jgi:FkbM family methyltransferase
MLPAQGAFHSMFRRLRRYQRVFGPRSLELGCRALLARGPVEVSVSVPGANAPVWLRLNSSDVRTFEQVFTDAEYRFPCEAAPKVIVDAGANVGFASIDFAVRWPNARIIAIEPERSNYALLCQNLKAYPNAVPVWGALWTENRPIDLVDPGGGHWAYRALALDDNVEPREGRVPGYTVDRLMRDHGIERIDLLKLDIEGAEKELFQHAEAWTERVDAIVIELHDRFKLGCSASFAAATTAFTSKQHRGENVWVSRPTRSTT